MAKSKKTQIYRPDTHEGSTSDPACVSCRYAQRNGRGDRGEMICRNQESVYFDHIMPATDSCSLFEARNYVTSDPVPRLTRVPVISDDDRLEPLTQAQRILDLGYPEMLRIVQEYESEIASLRRLLSISQTELDREKVVVSELKTKLRYALETIDILKYRLSRHPINKSKTKSVSPRVVFYNPDMTHDDCESARDFALSYILSKVPQSVKLLRYAWTIRTDEQRRLALSRASLYTYELLYVRSKKKTNA